MRHKILVRVSDILKKESHLLTPLKMVSLEQEWVGVLPPSLAQSDHLHFLSDLKFLKSDLTIPIRSGWIIAKPLESYPEVEKLLEQADFVASVSHTGEAMSVLLSLFDPRSHCTFDDYKMLGGAWIHSSAELDTQVKCYPGSVIGPYCKIGSHSEIRPHVTLEAFTELGKNTLIHGGSVLGSDGFGFYKNPKTGTIRKIPQIGCVVIHNDVEIGSNVSVDRATLTSTEIGEQTKLDNLIHIAHNTHIGKYGFFAAGFMCAGSIKIGDHFTCGGDVVVSDHVTICDHVTLGGRSVVTKDIVTPGHYIGYPLEPWKEGLRTLSHLSYVTELRKDLKDLKKRFLSE
jgi:UDP-3-O-[3-hydroxymyristoyl] glucosamine N-acyltransferase